MNRKRARHLFMELARRNYLKYYGSLKGFGKVAKFYREEWRPDVSKIGSYKACWEYPTIKEIRGLFNM